MLVKKFCCSLKRSMLYGIEDISRDLLHLPNTSDKLRKDEFWAVDDVSFEVKRGECLGIIGRNGAGKSTLLKMLNGIILPDKGKITIKGKVGALIEVGAGFHPMLTGRENVYVNGAILGMSKREIDKKFDEIVAFAELEESIDMPVKHYSSGMYVRLGFAIAAQLEPDVLILDEVLAVGDIRFQIKCANHIRTILKNTAVIFVSHSMQHIASICTFALFMKDGKTNMNSNKISDAIQAYYDITSFSEMISGTGEARIDNLSIVLENYPIDKNIVPIIQHDQALVVRLKFTISHSIHAAKLSIIIMDASQMGIIFFQVLDINTGKNIFSNGAYDLLINFGKIDLATGKYSFLIVINSYIDNVLLLHHKGLAPFKVIADTISSTSKIIRKAHATIRI